MGARNKHAGGHGKNIEMDQESNGQRVAIIMPVYNSGRHLFPAIMAIMENTKYPNYRLIIVESESTDGTDKLCDRMAERFSDKIEIWHTKKEGITKAINFGISKTTDEDIYLTQDDVIVPKLYERDWLEVLIKESQKEDCGAVTTIRGGGISGVEYIKDMQWAGTWSLYIPRKTINEVGILDEGFSPGPGDDIDYSYRIYKAKKKIYIADFWVDHHRQTQNFNDQSYLCMKGAGYFRKKHGIEPNWEPFEFDGEKLLIDPRSKNVYGCFNPRGEIDDKKTMRLIKEITRDFKDEDVFIDVGANTGMMSLMLQNGSCYAFEPDPESFEILKANTMANSWKNIFAINRAVLDNKIKVKPNDNQYPGQRSVVESEEGIESVTLDEVFGENFKIKLIKIDAEYSDSKVLRGAEKIIDKFKPIIIVESPDSEWIKKKGYKLEGLSQENSVWKSE